MSDLIDTHGAIEIREFEFMNALWTLMRAHREFSNLEYQPKYELDSRVLLPDMVCDMNHQKIVIECKPTGPYSLQKVDTVIAQLERYGRAVGTTKQILAFPSDLLSKYTDRLHEANIEVWDLEAIGKIFRGQLSTIQDTKLYSLLMRHGVQRTIEDQLAEELQAIPRGRGHWSVYQKKLAIIVEHLFCPALGKPIYELFDEPKVNRRDIIMPNHCSDGYWFYVRSKYMADYIVIDAKNFTDKIKKEEILQMANYLKEYGCGLFGIICARGEVDRDAFITRTEQWMVHRKLIVFLSDDDVLQMLSLRRDGLQPEEVIRQKIDDFRLAL